MKLPSINYLYQHAKASVVRFPLTIITSLTAVVIGIFLVENEHNITNLFPVINVMLCAALGIPLFFCIKVFTDKMKIDKIKSIAINAGGAVLLVLLYFTLPSSEETANTSLPYIRYAIYNIALHLLVSFAPYLKGKQLNGFWQYNRILFTRFILSIVYSGFLYIGIALAMGSMQLLFDVKIDGETYFEFFIFIGGFFNTWFFISGMPEDYDELDKIEHYPFGLKVFSQYILLPLLLLYLVILYMYGAKIIALWDWPKGVVSWLIIAISVLGIFTFLLIHPYGEKEQDSWIKKFTKIYYFLVIPLVVILFLAIGMRLADYGITINRYIIILLGVWLTIVSGYFIIGKNNIKFIPISLCAMILLMSFGPWSMFSVSERSQANRLERILEEHGIIKDGKVVKEQTIKIDSNYRSMDYATTLLSEAENAPNFVVLPDSISNEIKSIFDYLDDYHGFNSIKSWYKQNFDEDIKAFNYHKNRWGRINEAEVYMNAVGLEYKYYYNYENDYFSYSTPYQSKLSEITGYDYLINLDYYYYNGNNEALYNFEINTDQYELTSQEKDICEIAIKKNKTVIATINFSNMRDQLIEKYGKNYANEIPQKELLVIDENEAVAYKFEIQNINFRTEKGKIQMNSVNGKLMFRLKTKPLE
jgi:hypothetical protein